jgi:PilZ domain-containing protein
MSSDDRRGASRKAISYPGWVRRHDGLILECLLIDVSDGGACLLSEHINLIPDEFVLLFLEDGSVNRRCKTVWRSAEALGFSFGSPMAAAA